MRHSTVPTINGIKLTISNLTITPKRRLTLNNANLQKRVIEDYTCEWSFPIRTLLGKGRRNDVLEELRSKHNARRPLLVTDTTVGSLPIIQDWIESMKGNVGDNGNISIFSDVHPNPLVEDVVQGSEMLRKHNCDSVIAIGGGSSLDAAKSIAMYANSLVDDIRQFDFWLPSPVSIPDGGYFVPVITVPTTAGTGAEMGSGSMLTDLERNEKMCVGHPELSVTAILDPELTLDLPPNITAWTGMDAVTHAVEALLVPPVPKGLPPSGFHPMCDGAALQALRAINNNIEMAVKDGKENIVARAEMQVAAALAGVSFQKGLGAVHGLSEPIGATFNTQHGLTNAVILPWVLKDLQIMASNDKQDERSLEWRQAMACVENSCKQISNTLSLDQRSDFNSSSSLTKVISWVEEMNGKLGIPQRLRDILPVRSKDLTDVKDSENYQQIGHKDELLSENDILEMSHKAERNDTGFTNFIRFTHEDYQRVLQKCL